ncbi:MAG: hypothetical protein ACJ0QX_04775 [Gammaproteobacteria bacterium]|tara:strand:- start:2311 stop:2661 length:351 start_codon:yes stop_codon:yes gene_type:complete
MNYKNTLKYLLLISLTFNVNLSFATSDVCTEHQQAKVEHICHESLKNLNAHNELDTLDNEECSKCSFCTVANQIFHFNTVIQPQFSMLLLQKKFDSIKSYYSHILKPNGPPPKRII